MFPEDIAALENMAGISGKSKNISGMLPLNFAEEYNRANHGKPIIEGGLTYDYYIWGKAKQKDGIKKCRNIMTKFSAMLDKVAPAYIEKGEWGKANAAMLAVTKVLYAFEAYIEREFTDIDFEKEDLYLYKIPEAAPELKKELPKHGINFPDCQRKIDREFNAIKLKDRERLNW